MKTFSNMGDRTNNPNPRHDEDRAMAEYGMNARDLKNGKLCMFCGAMLFICAIVFCLTARVLPRTAVAYMHCSTMFHGR